MWKCKQKLNADMRSFDEVKKLSENCSTNMCLLPLRLIGVVDVTLAQEE